MRNGIPKKAVTLLAMAILFTSVPQGSASTFILDPAESYLTMAGSSSGLTALAQAPGSLTTSLYGTLQIGRNTVDALQITGSLINHRDQAGLFAPISTTASFAGRVIYPNGLSGYFAARNSHSHLWGTLPIVENSSQHPADQIQFTFATAEFAGQRPIDRYPGVEATSRTFDMAAVGPATLTAVGTSYRVEIPISSNSVPVLSNLLNIQFTGKIVGYSDVDPRLTPEIMDGSFVSGKGWFDPDRHGLTRINSIYEASFQEDFHGGGSASLIASQEGPARLAQEILGPGMLLPNTLYEVTFDIGNPTAETNYPWTGDEDRETSLDVYWSLDGLTRSGNYEDAGGIYRLDRLSDIPDEGWRRGQSILFDTSHLTPEQLAQGSTLVLQASSTLPWYFTSETRFTNFRIAIVPEPSSIVLALSATVIGCVIARQCRRKQPVRRSPFPSPT
jgi:hypothetical protein